MPVNHSHTLVFSSVFLSTLCKRVVFVLSDVLHLPTSLIYLLHLFYVTKEEELSVYQSVGLSPLFSVSVLCKRQITNEINRLELVGKGKERLWVDLCVCIAQPAWQEGSEGGDSLKSQIYHSPGNTHATGTGLKGQPVGNTFFFLQVRHTHTKDIGAPTDCGTTGFIHTHPHTRTHADRSYLTANTLTRCWEVMRAKRLLCRRRN